MVSEEASADTPQIANLDPERLRAIRDTLGLGPNDVPETILPPEPVAEAKPKRRRGRPRKYPVSETGTTVPELAAEEAARTGTPIPPATLSKKSEKEVAERLSNMLMAATGIASQAKPYLAMTDEEAKAISDPLASYLTRTAETVVVAQQILENYDLLAIVLGVLAYTVRIYRDRTNELAAQRVANASNPNNARRPLSEIVGQSPVSADGGQTNGNVSFISSPYGEGFGNDA